MQSTYAGHCCCCCCSTKKAHHSVRCARFARMCVSSYQRKITPRTLRPTERPSTTTKKTTQIARIKLWTAAKSPHRRQPSPVLPACLGRVERNTRNQHNKNAHTNTYTAGPSKYSDHYQYAHARWRTHTNIKWRSRRRDECVYMIWHERPRPRPHGRMRSRAHANCARTRRVLDRRASITHAKMPVRTGTAAVRSN